MKNTRKKTIEIIENYIVDKFSISESSQCSGKDSDAAYHPVHGLIFILVISGNGTIRTNTEEYPVKRATLVSIAPFQSYVFTKASDDLRYEYIAFELDFMDNFPLILKPYVAEKMEKEPCLQLNREIFTLLKKYHQAIMLQYKRTEHPSRTEMIKAQLYVYIAEVSVLYLQQTVNLSSSHQEQVTDDFLKLLQTFYRKERKPEFYAGKLCMSPHYLSELLKKTTGQTLYAWICKFVIKEAKMMLHSTNKSVSQIADELNFPNSSYFARYFRKYTGISPSDYKNS